ncbi:MAG: PEP-CTERM sorting domain-containing protein [Luteolibacter sp.]
MKATLLLLFATALSAAGAVSVSFSGGEDLPLSVTLDGPVTYVADQASSYVIFVLEDVATEPTTFSGAVSGTLTYSVNGGSSMTVSLINIGTGFGSVGISDLYFYASIPLGTALAPGDEITLTSGTLVSSQNYNGAIPVSGSYETFIAGGSLEHIGSAVPEPSSLLLGGLGSFALLRRRRA